MRKISKKLPAMLAALPIFVLAACQNPGDVSRPDVYSQAQVNTRQDAKVINILAVMPAKVAVDNSQNQRTAQIAGGLLGAVGGAALGGGLAHNAFAGGVVGAAGGGVAGAAAGSLVPGQVLVDGVSITYEDSGKTFNSAQVGQLCEYTPGKAVVVGTNAAETRIQPNATCPPPASKT